MTRAEEIMRAVALVIGQNKRKVFSRNEVREQIGVDRDRWMSGYTAIFQGMRSDHPGGAPSVGTKFEKVFERVRHGTYVLTLYGQQLIQELGEMRE